MELFVTVPISGMSMWFHIKVIAYILFMLNINNKSILLFIYFIVIL